MFEHSFDLRISKKILTEFKIERQEIEVRQSEIVALGAISPSHRFEAGGLKQRKQFRVQRNCRKSCSEKCEVNTISNCGVSDEKTKHRQSETI
jgi:hypothetical protein